MDIFTEYIVKKQKDIKDIFISIGLIIATVILSFIALGFSRYLGSFGLLIIVGIIYGSYWLISSRNIEYEYIVTNGELDIDKIIAQKRRKRLLSVHCREFDILAPMNDEKFKREYENVNIKKTINAASSMQAYNLYFAVFTHEGEKTRLIFEPTEKMLDSFKIYMREKLFIR